VQIVGFRIEIERIEGKFSLARSTLLNASGRSGVLSKSAAAKTQRPSPP
jgi:predicted FMN-binding regulatory protein PaiB